MNTDLHREKMDEFRQDMLVEQRMKDYDYFVDFVLNKYGGTLEALVNECKMHGHNYREIVDALLDAQ